MKHSLILGTVLLMLFSTHAQSYFSKLEQELRSAPNDTSAIAALANLATYYSFIRADSSFHYADRAFRLSDKNNYPYGKFLAYRASAYAYIVVGNYPKAMESALAELKVADSLQTRRLPAMAQAYFHIGILNRIYGDTAQAYDNFKFAIRSQQLSGEPLADIFFAYTQMSSMYSKNHPDSFFYFANLGHQLAQQSAKNKNFSSLCTVVLGNALERLGHDSLAKAAYFSGIEQSMAFNNLYVLAKCFNDLAGLYSKNDKVDSSIRYSRMGFEVSTQYNFSNYALIAARILARDYESKNALDSTLKYTKITVTINDSIFSKTRLQQFQLIVYADQERKKQLENARAEYSSRLKIYLLLGVLILSLLMAAFLFSNNRQKQKAYDLLQNQKAETERQQAKAETALVELQTAQKQLIQSEKMASLGELTAGIAHEIQNPLNFVNNFSELNAELIEELMKEQNKEDRDLSAEKDLLLDIKNNEQKINHHGRRADAIVKGMLQHTQSNSGQKTPSDINRLADEFLRLAYLGSRTKDKDCLVTFETSFDPRLGEINIIPQDIGRVLLNIFNNALYAVAEKKKQYPQKYEPVLSVHTRKHGNKAEIVIKDNGNGIPSKVINKIFQPFYTTKPTGQGTGLGLSLSYDIIKVHDGDIKVDTREGLYTEFTISLPL